MNLLVNDYYAWSVGIDRAELMTLDEGQRAQLRAQVEQATAEMAERQREAEEAKEEEERLKLREEVARGGGEVIEL